MLLPALEFLERGKPGILVVEGHDEAQGDLPVRLMIEEAATPGVVQRPSLGVDHPARLVLLRVDVPELLEADAVSLRLALLVELEDALQLLGQMPSRALGEEGVAAVKLHAGLVIRLVRSVPGDAHVAGGDALHRAVLVEQYLRSGEAREDLDTQRLGLAGEPAAEIAEAQRVGALIVHEGRHQGVREAELLLRGQNPMLVLRDRHRQRAVQLRPVRQQFVQRLRVDHGAREDMGADLGAFLEDADAELASRLVCELLQTNGGSEPGRAGADDHHVIGHGLAVGHQALPCAPVVAGSERPADKRRLPG